MNQINNIIEGTTNLAKKVAGAPDQEIEQTASHRYGICKQCPHLTITSNCSKCGCFMPSKTRAPKATCPISKW